jgi:hypothetical protein
MPSCVLLNRDGDKRQDGASGLELDGGGIHSLNPSFLSIKRGLFLVVSLFF